MVTVIVWKWFGQLSTRAASGLNGENLNINATKQWCAIRITAILVAISAGHFL